jgi:hypothetical protein
LSLQDTAAVCPRPAKRLAIDLRRAQAGRVVVKKVGIFGGGGVGRE